MQDQISTAGDPSPPSDFPTGAPGLAAEPAARRWAVSWTAWDIVAVLIIPVLITVIGLITVGGITRLVAGRSSMGFVENEPVIFGMTIGLIVYGLFFCAVWVVVKRRRVDWASLGVRRPPLLPVLLAPVILMGNFIAIAVVNLTILSLTGSFENPQTAAITGGQGFAWRNVLFTLLVVGLVAPFVEELIFRGLIFGLLRDRLPLWAAVVASAAIFSAAHVIPLLFPALFVVGISFAVVYHWSGSIWVSTLLHAGQNSLAVIAIFAALAGS